CQARFRFCTPNANCDGKGEQVSCTPNATPSDLPFLVHHMTDPEDQLCKPTCRPLLTNSVLTWPASVRPRWTSPNKLKGHAEPHGWRRSTKWPISTRHPRP